MSINKKRKEKYEPLPSEIAKLGIKPYMLYDDRYSNTNNDLCKHDGNIRRDRREYKKNWGFNYQILWDLGLSMAVELYIKLSAFKKYDRIGVPVEFENNSKEWEEIIDKMINAFRLIIEQDYSIHLPSGEDKTNKEMGFLDDLDNIGFENYLKRKMTDEQKEESNKRKEAYYENLKKEDEQIKEGLELFAKYFRNLWE